MWFFGLTCEIAEVFGKQNPPFTQDFAHFCAVTDVLTFCPTGQTGRIEVVVLM
jgi:hypothetical protein